MEADYNTPKKLLVNERPIAREEILCLMSDEDVCSHKDHRAV